jgi:monoamine oxidase
MSDKSAGALEMWQTRVQIQPMQTRRQFAKSIAAAAAALPFVGANAKTGTRRPAATSAASKPIDVLIIGAGLSGLKSALLLEELGAKVQIVEARQRIGGRVYTLSHLPGYPEVGGNGFAAGYGRILDQAKQLNLSLLDSTPRRMKHPKMELALDAHILQREEWTSSALNPLPENARARFPWEFAGGFVSTNNPLHTADEWLAESSAALDISMRDWLVARGLDDRAVNLCWSTNPYFGTSAHAVSALQCLYNDTWIKSVSLGSNASPSILGGNNQLPQGMAKLLKQEIHLGQEVVSVRQDQNSVEAVCRNGMRYRAKALICSVPFSVLRHMHFDPGFSGPQSEAINNLSYMVNTLFFFVPKKKFWEADGLSPTMWTNGPAGAVISQRYGADPDEVTGLVANPRGHMATWIDRLPPKEAMNAVQSEIERLRPAAKGALECAAMHSWARDPFAAGDWAVFAPGEIQRFARFMSAPAGRVYFCGEHTARANRGMEGAMESAERAVLEASAVL